MLAIVRYSWYIELEIREGEKKVNKELKAYSKLQRTLFRIKSSASEKELKAIELYKKESGITSNNVTERRI